MSQENPAPDRKALVTGSTAPLTGAEARRNGNQWSYHLSVAGSGAVTATATVEVSNDLAAAWVTFGTLSASGTAAAADAIVGTAPWAFHRARLDTITGTNAVATIAAAGV